MHVNQLLKVENMDRFQYFCTPKSKNVKNPKHFLPITKKELDYLGWDYVDVILISGDAYVDHPSFGTAVIGRILEKQGLRVAILPQPNWQDDLRDFKKLGKPRLFFGISAGNMDSMVNHYTANKRLRSDDAYTPDGKAGFRPDNATIVYSKIIKKLYPETPVVIGGIEASMRRLSHYDFWEDRLRTSILIESEADLLVYGMGEKPIVEVAKAMQHENWREEVKKCRQIAFLSQNITQYTHHSILLHSYEDELKNKKKYGENFIIFEQESNKKEQKTLIQPYREGYLVVHPPYPLPTSQEMDEWALFDVMMNAPHPKYAKRGDIPAFEMIKNSVTIHRGCFGGCSFCTISAHQGKFIASRSEESILREIKDLVQRDYFKGHISDLGGPSANMYKMKGKDEASCLRCKRNSCLFPKICPNLHLDHHKLTALYQKALQIKGVKQITIGSGIRYEMLIGQNEQIDKANGLSAYLENIVKHHVSGRLKVAPEHTAKQVTNIMRKPAFDKFLLFLERFEFFNRKSGKKQQLIPYFISAHPGCSKKEMAELSILTKRHRLFTDQVQEFTPTPMTYSTALYFLGYDPYSGENVFVAKKTEERKEQHGYFFSKSGTNTKHF